MRIRMTSIFFAALLLVGSGLAQKQAAPPIAYNVRDFGAAGDGKTLDSPALDRAIAAAAQAGGGTVHLPAGT